MQCNTAYDVVCNIAHFNFLISLKYLHTSSCPDHKIEGNKMSKTLRSLTVIAAITSVLTLPGPATAADLDSGGATDHYIVEFLCLELGIIYFCEN